MTFFGVAVATFSFIGITYIYYTKNHINSKLDQLSLLSKQSSIQARVIEEQSQALLKEFGAEFANPVYLMQYAKNLITILNKITGVGYAYNRFYHTDAFYILSKNMGTQEHYLKVIDMNSVFQKKGTYYYTRPWYQYVMKHRQKITYSPQINWFEDQNSDYTMTIAYPLFDKQDRVAMVGLIDISVDEFLENDFDANTTTLFEVDQYPGSVTKPGFYKLSSDHKLKESSRLENRNYHGLSDGRWYMRGMNLYTKRRFFDGGFSFIVEVRLVPIFLTFCALFLLFFLTLLTLTMFIFQRSKRHAETISTPFGYIAKYLSMFMSDKNLHSLDGLKTLPAISKEVFLLKRAIHKMIQNVQQQIALEKTIQQIEAKMDLAKSIQQSFFSMNDKKLQSDILSYGTLYIPAEHLSGDAFSVERHGEFIYFFLSDASGKNAAACIFNLFLLSRFKILAQQQLMPDAIMKHLNEYLFTFNQTDMFATAVCIRINYVLGDLLISNAGNEAPIILNRLGDSISCTEGELVLGLFDNIEYTQLKLKYSDIQWILIYSDGLSEAKNRYGFFGKGRLEAILDNNFEDDPQYLVETIKHKVNEFKNSASQDDMTAIAIKFNENNNGD